MLLRVRGSFQETADSPQIWTLSSYRAGENTQISGLAGRLGVPWITKRLHYRSAATTLGMLRRTSLNGIDTARSDPLTAPWPDLVIAAGLRNEPVARWIRARSGGRTRIVFLGRTWAPRRAVDLLVTTPQYRVSDHPRVQNNLLTMHNVNADRLAQARALWLPRFADLPRPWLGVLVGGSSGPYAFGPATAARLAKLLQARRTQTGGSVLATSSARTPGAAAAVLERELAAAGLFHRWRPDDPDNPYMGILSCADALMVTGDSVAMLSEAAATGVPVEIFPLPAAGGEDISLRVWAYRALMRWGPRRASRDVARFHREFVGAGYGRLIDPAAATPPPAPAPLINSEAEVQQTVARVLALVGVPDSALVDPVAFDDGARQSAP